MKVAAITDPCHRDMPFFKKVFEEAFPEDERCPWERMAGFLSLPDHHFHFEGLYLDDGTPIGFNTYSLFGRYLYGVYLAIDAAHRGAGHGHRALTDFHARHAGRLIFGEVEHPVTPRAHRRLAFYRSLGYHVSDIGFVQPPLGPGRQSVPYLLVSYPDALTSDDADAIRNILTNVIYRGL